MDATLKSYIDLGYSQGLNAFTYFLNARNHLYAAGDYIANQQWALAKSALYSSADDFGTASGYLLQDDVWVKGLRRHWKDALYWIGNNWPTGVTVTMADILNCMLGAKFDELQKFIGIEDAYRVALWNAPFNADFYAALARGFIKWP